MTQHQTVAAGTPPAGRWKSLGFGTVPVAFDLDTVFGMLVGEQNSGKSYLVQSNPNAFIINADDSPIVNPRGQACIWPSRNSDGRIIDLDGSPMVLTWESIEKKKQHLIQMAERGEDRPKCVVLDTLFPVLRLIRNHVIKQFNKTNWEDLHGPMAYERVYSTLIEFALTLRQHGYGVWFVAHISKRWHNLSETNSVCEYALSMSDGLKDRLSKTVELIAPVKSSIDNATIVEPQTLTVAGKTVTRNVTKTKTVINRELAFNDHEFAHLIRTRTLRPLSNVSLNEGNPWEAFSQAFAAAIAPEGDDA